MGQVVWISGVMVAAAAVWTVTSAGAERPGDFDYEAAFAEPEIGEPEILNVKSGSALATAAFGMQALQPETYNGETVVDLIQASPLTDYEKTHLTGILAAAEAGEADLSDVLTNVRVALAVD